MKNLVNSFKHNKWLILAGICCMVLIFSISLISFTTVIDINSSISHLDNAIKQHKNTLLLWHILIISAIYYCWGKKVSRAVKELKLSQSDTKKLMQPRYWATVSIIVVDLLAHWY